MTYFKFLLYSVVGSVLWVSLFLFGGYFFGNIPVVKRNFSLVIIVIVLISLIPAIMGYLKNRRSKKTN